MLDKYPSIARILDSVSIQYASLDQPMFLFLSYNGQKAEPETLSQPVDWKKTLDLFYDLDISKPAFAGSYEVKESPTGEGLSSHYFDKTGKNPVRWFSLVNDKIGPLRASGEIFRSNPMYEHRHQMEMDFRNIVFRLNGTRIIRWPSDTVSYEMLIRP